MKTIEEREKEFMDKLALWLSEFPKEMIRDFFDYWTERGEKDKKMRFEKEKVFDIGRRLKRWERNNKTNFGKLTKKENIKSIVMPSLESLKNRYGNE